MIAKLTGLIDSVLADSLIINVGGVGYQVFCSNKTLNSLTPGDKAVSLYIETHVREDHIHLFGFAEKYEQVWFQLLTTVQGVGAKVALAMLSVIEPKMLADAIVTGDTAIITQAPGVGPKLANRIKSELKDKLPSNLNSGEVSNSIHETQRFTGQNSSSDGKDDQNTIDAVSALVNLGYARNEAFAAAVRVRHKLGNEANVEQIIKDSLQELSSLGGEH